MNYRWTWLFFASIAVGAAIARPAAADELRRVISLDGTWQLAEGRKDVPPARFERTVPVPGLVDMAQPQLENVGVQSDHREAFWYRRTFRLKGPIPAVALLKIHKAMFGSRVVLNGKDLGEHRPAFTPGYFDIKSSLKEGENEILVRVAAFQRVGTKSIGWDYEKTKFIPGIFDSVEVILSGSPHIERVQAVPDVGKQTVTVHTWPAMNVRVTVREARSQRIAGEADGAGPVTIPLPNCRLWSPEDPFLYELTVRTAGDELTTRFGMRSFHLDPQTGRAILNGKPYFMRGSNVTLYRFFEDAARADLPWRNNWVRTLHQRFKQMHWNSLRYCIGLPPEAWYRIADEEGFLIQDEFPIWNMHSQPGDYKIDDLAGEYRDWMQERWNHPCVVVWDACNETNSSDTAAALAKVRGLDLSNRPWDNGWGAAGQPSDSRELHPYHFINPNYKLSQVAGDRGTMDWKPGSSPIIVNEYGWLWLNRDGTPTTLTRQLYKNLLGPNSTTAQRRQLYARYTAAETEFWRCHRACAAVMHFCGLGYSRPDGQTSDHWTDVVRLTWEPEFYRYVRDAFAPVGLMIDAWDEAYAAGKPHEIPVVVINDLPETWKGEVRLRILRGGQTVAEERRPAEVAGWGSLRLAYRVTIPQQSGDYRIEATLLETPVGEVRSLRDFAACSAEQIAARNGIAVGKPVTASSSINRDGATSPAAVVDGKLDSRWSSEFSDPQWLAVDLGSVASISRVELVWEAAYGKNYAIQVSSDGHTWKDVYKTGAGKGGVETVRFAPVKARWVRMFGTQRASTYGYSLWEFRVFPYAD
jgi:beta-galactosidase